MVDIKKNVEAVRNRISDSCRLAGREISDVKLLAATKYVDYEAINQLLEAGVSLIGENKIQDAKQKLVHLPDTVRKHFIGHLQTNKVKEAVKMFDCIESVDSERLLFLIEEAAGSQKKEIDVYLEVNISGEDSKFGVGEGEVDNLLRAASGLSHVRVTGLMMMLPNGIEESEQRRLCSKMKRLFDGVRRDYPDVRELSMGMSNDFEVAIEEGSTEVRIGSLLFSED